ncbi:acyl-coenzyme A synthetase/AMP-(fatty) acid ligase [Streptomyces paradoxus]|uniref:Acyl-coenzyme A synthetase/AMP-(Fatty) acid ligase n=1 Tax=Streptomyces paradoxus TaxID=66375 RepID=A0A7W9T5X4_9ACTN|nr:acyl-coenzyme A synthetase/AMP-(fatty) acid ligase [Streptomyces paradoxus]
MSTWPPARPPPGTVSTRDELPKTTSGKILRRELRGKTSA